MQNRFFKVLVPVLLFLALFGLGYKLATHPSELMINLLITFGIVAVISVFAYLFIFKRGASQSPEMKKYRQAVKQSKRKYTKQTPVKMKQTAHKEPASIRKKMQKKRPSHLRVIEGNKPDKKNRALF